MSDDRRSLGNSRSKGSRLSARARSSSRETFRGAAVPVHIGRESRMDIFLALGPDYLEVLFIRANQPYESCAADQFVGALDTEICPEVGNAAFFETGDKVPHCGEVLLDDGVR